MPRQTTQHIDAPAQVGRRLRDARIAAGLTQTALAFPGCSVGYISRIEAGLRVPSLQVVRELAHRLGVSESWLAVGEDSAAAESARASLASDADLALRFGHVDEAAELFARLEHEAASPAERARALAGLGHVAYQREELPRAIELLEEALREDSEIRDGAFFDVLGRAYARTGDVGSAVGLFRRALARAEELGDPSARLRFAVLLADALIDAADFQQAAALLAQVLTETDGGDPVVLARMHWSQARLHAQRREHEVAARHARRAVELLDASEHALYRARAHHLLGSASLDAGDPLEALRVLEAGLALLGKHATPRETAAFRLEMARALAMLGRTEEAASLALAAAADHPVDHPANAGRSFAALAQLFDERGEEERALELYELALELLERAPTRHAAEACARYGALLERLGRRDGAFEVYKRAALLQAQLEQAQTGVAAPGSSREP